MESTLFSAFLEVFAGDESRRDGGRSLAPGSSCLRRAEDFLRAHLMEPVSLHAVAEAVEVSPRTLSRAFKARYGVGPMGFHRALRLEATFREFRQTEPGGDKVMDVALKYGFNSMGRFAAEYRGKFGELPSQTLKKR